MSKQQVMTEFTLKIQKTTLVENPLPELEWYKKYKVGSRIPKKQIDCDMYHRKEYDFDKLVNLIKHGQSKPTWYERILGFKVA